MACQATASLSSHKVPGTIPDQAPNQSSNLDASQAPNHPSIHPSIRDIKLTLLAGVYDDGCVLSRLRGIPHIVKCIFILATNDDRWRRCIVISDIYKEQTKEPAKADEDDSASDDYEEVDAEEEEEEDHRWPDSDEEIGEDVDLDQLQNRIFFTNILLRGDWYSDFSVRQEFPEPKDININMMPFVLGSSWEECQLPDYLQGYWPLINGCVAPEAFKEEMPQFFFRPRVEPEIGKICFLTVQESLVEAGSTQRRPGLHVDCAGIVKLAGAERGRGGGGGRKSGRKSGRITKEGKEGDGESWRFRSHYWGHGGCQFIPRPKTQPNMDENEDEYEDSDYEEDRGYYQIMYGGIYMASTVDASCKAWNCKIIKDKKSGREVIGKHGNIEHLRHLLSEEHATTTKANQMYWMTDRTPHESIPLKAGTYRQFFRLVTSRVSLWFEDHSTPNPKGVKPDPKITKVVKGNKFSEDGVFVVVEQEEEGNEEDK